MPRRSRRAARPRPPPPAPIAPVRAPEPIPAAPLAVAGVLGSLLVHGAILVLIVLAAVLPRKAEVQKPVEFVVVETPKPPPPPEPPKPPPEEPKAPEPPKVVKARPRPQQPLPPPPKNAPPPPAEMKEELPPPPNEPPPPDAKPSAPVMIGISMSSTTTAGSFAAPVGNTLYGSAPNVAPRAEDVKPYASPTGRYVPPHRVARLPEPLSVVQAAYPDEARKLGLEGQVQLRLTIDGTGAVVKVVVLKGAGHGFDDAAVSALQRSKFRPGTDGSEPVTTEITYTYTFILD